jgi:pimeloyl-ACP methyl ester carboxylesterase
MRGVALPRPERGMRDHGWRARSDKEPGTDPFAARFHEAGFTVLAFDYRRLGASGGHPRQVVRVDEQLADWEAALAFARALPTSTPPKSRSGASRSLDATSSTSRPTTGTSAARSRIPRSPTARPPHRTPCAIRRHSDSCASPAAPAWMVSAASWAATPPGVARRPAGHCQRPHHPRRAQRRQGAQSRQRLPGPAAEGGGCLGAARRLLPPRPPRLARPMPLLVIAHDDDGAALCEPAVRAGRRARQGEVVRLPGGHYEA